MVGAIPSRRALSRTCLTRSGRDCALPSRLFSANSTTMRSVPAETSEAATFTRACPARGAGMGTSSIVALPVLMLWRSCFILIYDTSTPFVLRAPSPGLSVQDRLARTGQGTPVLDSKLTYACAAGRHEQCRQYKF